MRSLVRAVIFDAGNTLLRMNYGVIAEHLRTRGHAAGPSLVEEAELRARVRLDPHLAPGATSTASGWEITACISSVTNWAWSSTAS